MTPRARHTGLAIALFVFLPVAATAVAAQVPKLMVAPRGGAAVPFASFAGGERPGEGASAGASLGMAFGLSIGSAKTWTLGFSQHRFGCDEAGCEADGRYVATGIDFGVRMNFGVTRSVTPWIRLGGITSRVEVDDLPGGGVSTLGYGGEVGAGAYIRLAERWGLDPGVRVVAVNTDLPSGSLLRLRYWVADIGLAFGF